MIKMLIKRAAAALRADEMQVRSRADACSSKSFFSPTVHVTRGSAPNNALSPSDVNASAVKLHPWSTRRKVGQWGDLNEAPEKSGYPFVPSLVPIPKRLNLPGTPFFGRIDGDRLDGARLKVPSAKRKRTPQHWGTFRPFTAFNCKRLTRFIR
jgi:hypothetical protein